MSIEIRRMTGDDVAAVIALRGGEPHDPRGRIFDFAVAHPGCDAVVAAEDGVVVGSGIGTCNGPAGWVGAIFVAETHRRRGLGRALTDRIVKSLTSAGCRTLVLVASEMGRPMYERMGFEVTDWYVNLEHVGPLRTDPGDRTIAPFRVDDLRDAVALDRAATGEDRAHLLTAFAAEPGGLVVRDGDAALRAFRVGTPWGLGATIAPDPADAQRILVARAAAAEPGHRGRTGVLASNAEGLAMLAADGWAEAWRAPRMHHGEPLAWQPASIWGQLSFAMG